MSQQTHVTSQRSTDAGVWRYAKADKVAVIIDAADYFDLMQQAMLKARSRIFLIGWDFDTRIHLKSGRRWWQRVYRNDYPRRLGAFFAWLVRQHKELEIRILKWSFGAFKFTLRGTMWWDLLRWIRHRRIDFKFDNSHPVGACHHQKLAILDNSLAVCGGIDMTVNRWDTREHRESDPRRTTPSGFQYPPWHDASLMMEGEVAHALTELGNERWAMAGGKRLAPIKPSGQKLWPEGLAPDFENVEIGIARTRAEYRDYDEVREIEELFVSHIERAQHFIYAESQYFASRAVGEAILARLEGNNPPEIVIIHPESAEGWLEAQAMDHARAEIVRCIEKADRNGCFSIWCPKSGDTPIYVHAKIMIIDDEILRIGSANLNNRSMGLDSECDVFIDAARQGNAHARKGIKKIRCALLAEHLGLDEQTCGKLLDDHVTMSSLIDRYGIAGPRRLCRYHPPELNSVEETIAHSSVLDPEGAEEVFEPFANGGLFREGSRLVRMRKSIGRILNK